LKKFLRYELENLVDERLLEIRATLAKKARPITSAKRTGFTNIFDSFDNVYIPEEVLIHINTYNNIEYCPVFYKNEEISYFKTLDKNTTLKDIADVKGSLGKTLARIRHVESELNALKLNRKLSDEELFILDYIRGLEGSFVKIQSFLNKNKSENIRDYCVLCWRRVHNAKKYSDQKRIHNSIDSKYYCPKHHPNKSKSNHMNAFRSLVSAIMLEKPKLSNELENMKSKKLIGNDRARILEKCLLSFTPINPPPVKENSDWKSIVSILIQHSKIHYPFVYEKIKDSLNQHNSWEHWFLDGVISKFRDEDSDETRYWDVTIENSNRVKGYDEMLKEWGWKDHKKIGWLFVTHLFRRYQSYQYIMSIPKKTRGKGKVAKETPLKINIKKLLEKAKTEGLKPNVKAIAIDIKTSPKNVYSVKNEMKALGIIF
jgi:hypothetical protein